METHNVCGWPVRHGQKLQVWVMPVAPKIAECMPFNDPVELGAATELIIMPMADPRFRETALHKRGAGASRKF